MSFILPTNEVSRHPGAAQGEAEDLLQEAFLRLSRVWQRVSGSGSLDAYVRRTMVNLRTSRWRRRRVHAVTMTEVPELARPADDATRITDRDEMWLALSALPPRMRAVLVLRFYEDLTEAETAAVLECSIGTVKSQSSRALDKLRESLPERTSQC
jgi:RNA polymerase sigma-70 factor (sigma-E family)